MGVFDPITRGLDDREAELYNRLIEMGLNQGQVAQLLASMGGTTYARGENYLTGQEPKTDAIEGTLNKIISGEQSFIDDKYAQTLYSQARENAAREFSQADHSVGEQMNRRGLFGGGQHAAALRGLASDKAAALGQQNTAIYSDVAQRKATERASALDALMNQIQGNRQLGLALTGLGGQNMGQASNSWQGIGANWSNTMGNLLGRPQGPSYFSQAMGGVLGAANTDWSKIADIFKRDTTPANNPQPPGSVTGGGMMPLQPQVVENQQDPFYVRRTLPRY